MRFFSARFVRNFLTFLVFAGIVSLAGGSYITSYYLPPSSDLGNPPDHFTAAVSEKSEITANDLATITSSSSGKVMGDKTGFLTFVSANNTSSNGGMIVLQATEKPTVQLRSDDESGMGRFNIYRVGEQDVLNYLLYKRADEKSDYGSSLVKLYTIDRSKLQLKKSFEQQITAYTQLQPTNDVSLPISDEGIWFLEGTVNEAKVETMLIRSKLGAIIHKGDNENIFWVQGENYQSIPDVSINLLNLEKSISTIGTISTNAEGLATAPPSGMIDLAVVKKDNQLTIIPVFLTSLNYLPGSSSRFNSSFGERETHNYSFFFTDRFLYQPGDTINYKAIIRHEDDAEYSIQPQEVTITLDFEPGYKRTGIVSELGTVDGSIQLPKDIEPGYYYLQVTGKNSTLASEYIQVAQYRKPSASVHASIEKMSYLPGETLRATVEGSLFLGQPIRNQPLKYKIYADETSNREKYDRLNYVQNINWHAKSTGLVAEGTANFDKTGKATIEVPVKNNTGSRQFWILHVEYMDGASVSTTDAVQTMVQPGDFIIIPPELSPKFLGGIPIDIRFALQKNTPEAQLGDRPVTANLIHMLPRTADKSEELEQGNISITTQQDGSFTITVSPKYEGTYYLQLSTEDVHSNPIKEIYYFDSHVFKTNAAVEIKPALISVKMDKKVYGVGDTAQIAITAQPEISSVFVSVGRAFSRLHRVVPVQNGKGSLSIPILETYKPNVSVVVGSFSGDQWQTLDENITVDSRDKKVSIKLIPSQQVYGPAETAQFEIVATDGSGKPVQTDLAFWLFDKSLLELHGMYFDGIFDTFWEQRWAYIPTNHSFEGIRGYESNAEMGGGCFTGDTQIAMADGSSKFIRDVQAGDTISTFASEQSDLRVAATVERTHEVVVAGYLRINGQLKVTPEHVLLVNGQWKPAGEINVGDYLRSADGSQQTVETLEWLKERSDVYNLYIEKYHTFIANNIYVHNDKDSVRSIFKDTAYWNPHIQTDEQGKAKITFKLPDNLTTWVAAAVSANAKTQVGTGTTEFIVTKDLVVQPVLPIFLRVGDHIALAAMIQNFQDNVASLNVTASFSAGSLANATVNTTVEADDLVQLSWPVVVEQSSESAVFRVQAKGEQDTQLSDEVVTTLPAHRYGFWREDTHKLDVNSQVELALTPDTDLTLASVSAYPRAQRYSSVASMYGYRLRKDGLDFGVSDYSSVNQYADDLLKLSLITKYGDSQKVAAQKAEIDTNVAKIMKILRDSQRPSGTWFDHDEVIPVTDIRALVESCVMAKEAGLIIDNGVLEKVLQYVAGWQSPDWRILAEQQYVYSLFPDRQFDRKEVIIVEGAETAYMTRALMANVRQNFTSKQTAASKLMGLAKETPTQLAWVTSAAKPNGEIYTEHLDTTTWAVRAMQLMDADQQRIEKSLDYLYRSRHQDSLMSLVVTNYYEHNNQLHPSGAYQLALNDLDLAEGRLETLDQNYSPIVIPTKLLINVNPVIKLRSATPSFVNITQREFVTTTSNQPEQHGLTITRDYKSTKKEGEPTIPGDLVQVQLTVGGFGLGEKSVEIIDYLPSGLVAVDGSLDNDTFEKDGNNTVSTSRQLVDQGISIHFSPDSDSETISYRARVVSQGEFNTPPATVRVLTDPSIWASTSSTQLVVDGKHALVASQPKEADPTAKKLTWKDRVIVLVFFGTIGGIVFLIVRQVVRLVKRHHRGSTSESPPNMLPEPPQMPPVNPPNVPSERPNELP